MELTNKPLSDFAWSNKKLAWQRQVTFAAGTVLVAFHQNVFVALLCYSICLLSEFLEMRLCQQILGDKRIDPAKHETYVARLVVSGLLHAGAIVVYISVVVMAEGPSIHIGPLFFLLMASLYTAMNTSQLPQVMAARLGVFFIGFLFVPLYELLRAWPTPQTDHWTQLGTSVFVLFFVTECARKFSSNYQAVQRKMEDLRVDRDRLAAAFDVQSQFVSTASHELRTPLTSIKASLDLITTNDVWKNPEDVRRLVQIGQRNSARLAALINDLLDFQKLNAGGMQFHLEQLDLRDVVNEAAQVNGMLGHSKGVGFEVSLPEAPVLVMADKGRLMQVMANILSNAVKYSHANSKIQISVEQDQTKGRVLVRDFGIGIPENARDLVFAPFAQVDGSENRAYGGTGLGMSICSRIMQGQGGLIDYESKLGEGTAFFFELALTEAAAVESLSRPRENSDQPERQPSTQGLCEAAL